MNAAQARSIPIPRYLEFRGVRPAHTRMNGRELWYSSPIRSGDSSPSFKVDAQKNLWFDHGLGKGGNLIDLVLELCSCSVRDALYHLEKSRLYSEAGYPGSYPAIHTGQLPTARAGEKEKTGKELKLTSKGPLEHPALLQYLEKRKIDGEVARKYVVQIDFKAPQSSGNYFGIGYPAGDGFEVRNALFKGFVGSRKDISIHSTQGASQLLVFEGFIDLLTYLTAKKAKELSADLLVLNSTNLKARALRFVRDKKYDAVQLFLDNDPAGDLATAYFIEEAQGRNIVDLRAHYAGFADLNEWYVAQNL